MYVCVKQGGGDGRVHSRFRIPKWKSQICTESKVRLIVFILYEGQTISTN